MKIEMHFLPDVYVPCDVCKGNRYNRETLEVRYKGKNIYRGAGHDRGRGAGVLPPVPKIGHQAADPVRRGPGLRQARSAHHHPVRAARPSASSWPPSCPARATGRTLYILDEPTTGLACRRRGAAGSRCFSGWPTRATRWWSSSTIWTSSRPRDYVIDLGPEGGDRGGHHRRRRHARTGCPLPGKLHRRLPQKNLEALTETRKISTARRLTLRSIRRYNLENAL